MGDQTCTTAHEMVGEATVANLAAAASRLIAAVGGSTVLVVLLAEEGAPDLEELVAALGRTAPGCSFVGGVFPALIEGAVKRDRGAIVLALPASAAPQVVRAVDTRRGRLAPGLTAGNPGAVIVLVDGLCRSIATILEALYDRFGNTVAYWGGGAGSFGLEARPCVFSNDGVFQDAAVVAFSTVDATLGVHHGWKEILGPLVATRTDGNRIVELNWERAFDVYREAVAADSGREATVDDFFEVAKGYPFGVRKQGAEPVVRDPIGVESDGSLVCVGDVPENAVLAILKGEPSELIAAAGRAAEEACRDQVDGRLSLVVDCISRVIFLQDRFPEELEAMEAASARTSGEFTQLGVLTLGEISSYGKGYLEFFNRTAVVASVVSPDHRRTSTEPQ